MNRRDIGFWVLTLTLALLALATPRVAACIVALATS